MDKKILYKIDRDDPDTTLKDFLDKLEEMRKKYPDKDVFFDGDEYAVCSRPKKKEE
ncbi:hypothetical protein KAR91_01820 [Candidatus Pacearchaeota archaeon]|nr:hypothetical protein [Candidatus Pacearchaeota archaeon]